jgi:hypothetical protein
MVAPDSPVRQPRHPTVRVLTVLTVGALTDWGTGQSGAALDSHYSLSGAPSGAALPLRALFARTGQSLFTVRCAFWRCSASARAIRALFTVHFCRRPLAQKPLLCMAHRTVQCYTGQSGEL